MLESDHAVVEYGLAVKDAEVAAGAQVHLNVAGFGHPSSHPARAAVHLACRYRCPGSKTRRVGSARRDVPHDGIALVQGRKERGSKADLREEARIEAPVQQVVRNPIEGGSRVVSTRHARQLVRDEAVDAERLCHPRKRVGPMLTLPQQVHDDRVVIEPVLRDLKEAGLTNRSLELLDLLLGAAVHEIVGALDRISVPIDHDKRRERRGNGDSLHLGGGGAASLMQRFMRRQAAGQYSHGIVLRPPWMRRQYGVLLERIGPQGPLRVDEGSLRSARTEVDPKKELRHAVPPDAARRRQLLTRRNMTTLHRPLIHGRRGPR